MNSLRGRWHLGAKPRGHGYLEDLLACVSVNTPKQTVLAAHRDHGPNLSGRCGSIDRPSGSHVPVVQIVRHELLVPFQPPGPDVDHEHRAGIEVLAFAHITIKIRHWVADRHVETSGFRVNGRRHPDTAATTATRL